MRASLVACLLLGLSAGAQAAPVTREEAEAVLAGLGAAHAREDQKAVESAYRGPLARDAGIAARDLFRDRNRIDLAQRIDAAEADGEALRAEVVVTLRSRHVNEPADRFSKRRVVMRFARDDRGAYIESAEPGEQGLLASSRSWRARSFSGTVTLSPEDLARGRARIALVVGLANDGHEPADELAFLLHPFATDVVVAAGGRALAMTRLEGSFDAWRGRLETPVEALGSLDLAITYAIDQAGANPDCAIEPDLVRLYQHSAWLPQFSPPAGEEASRVTHDLVVLAPPDLVTTMPGIRSTEPPRDGLAASRFRSVVPAVEVPLVAAAGSLATRDLGGGIELEVLRRAGGGDPAAAMSLVVSLAAFLEDHVGACPVPRLVLVEAGAGGFREAPGFMAVPTLDLRKLDEARDEERRGWIFLARSLARAFVVHGSDASGPAATVLLAGLVDHLAGAWAGAAMQADIPVRQRGSILSAAASAPFLDQPLVPMVPGPPPDFIFGRGKARFLFEMLSATEGGLRLEPALAGWRRGGPGASIDEFLRRLGGSPERDALIASFARGQGFADVLVEDVRARPLTDEEAQAEGVVPGTLQRIEIVVGNRGMGPVPVPLRVEVDGRRVMTSIVVPGNGSATASLVAAGFPIRVRLDPEHVIWQVELENDAWPERLPRQRDVSRIQLGVSDRIIELPVERNPARTKN